MRDKRKKDFKKKKVQEQIENKAYEVLVEETRCCVKNADASVYCDPEKDFCEKPLKSDWTNLKLFNRKRA